MSKLLKYLLTPVFFMSGTYTGFRYSDEISFAVHKLLDKYHLRSDSAIIESAAQSNPIIENAKTLTQLCYEVHKDE